MPEPMRLRGVPATTLLGYLKGLGLLRIIARQADPTARIAWRDGVAELTTELDREALHGFLLDGFVPAPVVSPWNGGSGFFPKDAHAAFDAIEADRGPRLDSFRATIHIARSVLAECGLTEKPDPKNEKPRLLQALRSHLPDDALEWLDTAIVLVEDRATYPPLLGSGGNDGRYDIANNYAQAVVFALALTVDRDVASAALAAALWGGTARLEKMSLAHLFRDASPVNSPLGEADALGNPWDLVLATHGALVFSAGASRRLAVGASAGLAAPFTVRPTGAGYGSAVSGEKGRDELWLPTWTRSAALPEIEGLFREARTQVGRRNAATGLDAARAAGQLGVTRGVDGFERISILERAGQSNLAVHAGHIEVRPRAGAHALRTIDNWLSRALRHVGDSAPASHADAVRRVEQAAFALAERDSVERVTALIVALGAAEVAFSKAGTDRLPDGLHPPHPNAGPWLDLLGLGRVEHRLAAAFASLRDRRSERRLPTVREYVHAVAPAGDGKRLEYGVHTHGRVPMDADIVTKLALLSERRQRDAARDDRTLRFDQGRPVALGDLTLFASGSPSLDWRLLAGLIDGLVLMDFNEVPVRSPKLGTVETATDPLVALLALASHDPRSLPTSERCAPRPDWPTWLRAGRADRVVEDALLRLRLAGLSAIPAARDFQTETADSARLAAALLPHPAVADLHRAIAELADHDRSTMPSMEPAT